MTSHDNPAATRLDTLEIKVMELEMTVQQLNDVIIEQSAAMAQVRREQRRLQGQLNEALAGSADGDPATEVPPHY